MSDGRLDSWKEIADYLGKGVSTVRRWEREDGLPVRRLEHTKRGSVVAFQAELDSWLNARTTPLAEAAPVPERKDPILWLWTPVLAAALTGLLLLAGRLDESGHGEPRLLPVTRDNPFQESPGLSPDGRFVAYELREAGQAGIVAQEIESGVRRQVTHTPGADVFPRWSPDGSRIVFTRVAAESRQILIVDTEGGEPKPVRKIGGSTFPESRHEWATWMPDGKALLIVDRENLESPFAIYLHELETGRSRRITTPLASTPGDTTAAASPDGKRLAFVRHLSGVGTDIFVCEIAGCAPKRITFESSPHLGLAWTPDGHEIFYSTHGVDMFANLRRVKVSGGSPSARVEGVIPHAVWPSVAAQKPLRVAYQWTTHSIGISRWSADDGQPALPNPPSGRRDVNAQVSPDGTRIAFVSNRDGFGEIWTSKTDGSDPKKLTAMQRPYTDSPRWSPDGSTLVFSTTEGDNRDIYTVPAGGGAPRRMTTAPSEEGRPNWSADGKWIYFRSNSGGAMNIWRIPATGGTPEQVTTDEGYEAFASADGVWLYFTKQRSKLGLWRIRTETKGPGEKVGENIREGYWGLAGRSAVFLRTQPRRAIWRLDPDTRSEVILGELPEAGGIYGGFGVSAGGTEAYYSYAPPGGSDVALLVYPR